MSGLISNRELKTELEALLPNCKRLTIISAFITQPATRWLSSLMTENKPDVQLVGRFSPLDFIKGSSDLNALRYCINNGYKVKALTNLHAKIYQIDENIIFNGSANLTGKGLALVDVSNLECCSKITACDSSKLFIERIVNSASELTIKIIDDMEEYISHLNLNNNHDKQLDWPAEIISQPTDLFVSDLPLCPPGHSVIEYEVNPSLPFAQIEDAKNDFYLASKIFKQSKAYKWLVRQIRENKSDRDLGFGQISRLLHESLADDVSIYRQDVKYLQAHLYHYVKLYARDEIEVYIPGRRSEVLKFKSDLKNMRGNM
ncbi:MAG: phospholipase D-like domain-containing protein [Plesiomonas shigelloides]